MGLGDPSTATDYHHFTHDFHKQKGFQHLQLSSPVRKNRDQLFLFLFFFLFCRIGQCLSSGQPLWTISELIRLCFFSSEFSNIYSSVVGEWERREKKNTYMIFVECCAHIYSQGKPTETYTCDRRKSSLPQFRRPSWISNTQGLLNIRGDV